MAFRGEENSGYRAEKSSARLERGCQINNDITFSSVKLEGFVFICLLSSAHMTVNEAIVSSYLAGTRDTLKDADITLRTMIKKAFDESTSLKWQPKADELGALIQDKIPEKLLTFLNVVFSRQDPKSEKCKKKRCLIYSIGQDICRAVKNGEWKLPNGLQPPGARTLPEYERDIKNKKTSYKVSVLEKLHQSQYTTVLDQSFPRMPLSFLHWETFLNLIYVY